MTASTGMAIARSTMRLPNVTYSGSCKAFWSDRRLPTTWHVGFTPIAPQIGHPSETTRGAIRDLMHCSKQNPLFDRLVGAGEQSGIRRFLGDDMIREHIYFPIPWIGRHLCPDPVRKREFLASVS